MKWNIKKDIFYFFPQIFVHLNLHEPWIVEALEYLDHLEHFFNSDFQALNDSSKANIHASFPDFPLTLDQTEQVWSQIIIIKEEGFPFSSKSSGPV